MKDYIINSEIFKSFLEKFPIVIVDGGARDKLFAPFNLVKEGKLKIIKFEPDIDAFIVKEKDTLIYKKALWKNTDVIKIHIANDPSTSSVYPPNLTLLDRFEDNYGSPVRRTVKILEMEGETIDNISKKDFIKPDFIKLDIHSAEYEALQGSIMTLENYTLGVLVETWSIPVHEKQKLNSDVEKLLNTSNFFLFDIHKIPRWKYKKDYILNLRSKSQIIGLESLYFKDLEHIKDKDRLLKFLILADLFDFPNLSIIVNDYLLENKLISNDFYLKIKQFLIHNNQPLNFLKRIKKRLGAIKRAFSFSIDSFQ